MAQKFALARIQEITDHETDAAAASLGGLNRELNEQESRLMLLFKYRTEYHERLQRAAASGLDGAAMRNYHEFLQRLERAIMQQHALVVEARTRVEHGKLEWQNRRRKSMAFDSLSRRFELKTLRDEANREQKAQDELAQRGAHRHSKHSR
jgi:flagellar FliJ protein